MSNTTTMLSRTFAPAEFGASGTLLSFGGLWLGTVGGDAFYPLNKQGVYDPSIQSIYDVEHGVKVEWIGQWSATAYRVSWCACHGDHPVVAAATVGDIKRSPYGLTEATLVAYESLKATRAAHRVQLLHELAELDRADAKAERELAEQLPAAQRQDAAKVAARRRKGVASARRRINERATARR